MRRFAVVLSAAALAAGSLVVGSTSIASSGPLASTRTFPDPGANGTADNEYPVPPGVCEVTIVAFGANGGAGASTDGAGGLGGRAIATISVTPGETLAVFVGGRGGSSSGTNGGTAGINGGGAGGNSAGSVGGGPDAGGGGGGASDVRQGGTALANRVVIGGGGGGGGGASEVDTTGGDGGGTTGQDGNQADPDFANPGLGGTQTAGGAGGLGEDFDETPLPALNGGDGSLGNGGHGGNGTSDGTGAAGGAGGGGYYGGGGAASKNFYSSAGGGGGSGFTPDGTGLTQGVDAENDGDGAVDITPAEPGIGCPPLLEVAKVVSGTSTGPFTVHVMCARMIERVLQTTVDDDLLFAKDGAPVQAQAPPDWVVANGVWQLEHPALEGSTCTVTETGTAGATTVSYKCAWAAGVLDGVSGVGCPGSSSGPSGLPATVTFEGNGDTGRVTVTNTFVETIAAVTFTG